MSRADKWAELSALVQEVAGKKLCKSLPSNKYFAAFLKFIVRANVYICLLVGTYFSFVCYAINITYLSNVSLLQIIYYFISALT